MIIATFVLCLILNGQVIEHTYQASMSDCLSTKRKIERNLRDNYKAERWKCDYVEAEVAENMDGNLYVVKIIGSGH